MRYISGYLWKKGKRSPVDNDQQEWNEEDSVLLYQLRYDKVTVVLACVSDGRERGGYLTGQMKIWLQEHISILVASRKDCRQIRILLEKELKRIRQDLQVYERQNEQKRNAAKRNVARQVGKHEDGTAAVAEVNFSGILIIGKRFWLIQGGKSESYFFNRKFQRTHSGRLGVSFSREWKVTEGGIEKGVGIWLGSQTMTANLSFDVVRQCLAAQDILREGQIERRLNELSEESIRKGLKEDYAAVYIKSVG